MRVSYPGFRISDDFFCYFVLIFFMLKMLLGVKIVDKIRKVVESDHHASTLAFT